MRISPMMRANSPASSASVTLFSGLDPNQPVTRIVQARLENGQIFWFIVNDQDVDGRLSMQDGRRSRTRCLRRGSYVLSSPGKGRPQHSAMRVADPFPGHG